MGSKSWCELGCGSRKCENRIAEKLVVINVTLIALVEEASSGLFQACRSLQQDFNLQGQGYSCLGLGSISRSMSASGRDNPEPSQGCESC